MSVDAATDLLRDLQTFCFVILYFTTDSVREVTMGKPVKITNLKHSAADLCWLASREKRGSVVRRLWALAMILEGSSRAEAVKKNGFYRKTLRYW